GKAKEAARDYRQAQQVLSGLPRGQGLEQVARTHSSLGTLWISEQPAKAAESFNKAIESWTTLTAGSTEPRFRYELAIAYRNRGTLDDLQSRRKEAEADYTEAARLLTALV